MPDIPTVQRADGVYIIDTRHMGNSGTVAVFLLESTDGLILIESGPGSTLENVRTGIRQAGFNPADIRHILVTHIHLDHAGGAGELAKETGATVYVHERGYKHLHDPSRLLSSAERIYGDRMDELWGTIMPIPTKRLVSLSGGETLNIGGRTFKPIYTPGHASHHLAYLLDDGALFTGDAAAIHFEGSAVIRPALPPPEIDLDIWQESVARMLAAEPKRLLLTHYGEVQDAASHLERIGERNRVWAEEILTGMKQGEDEAALVERISNLGNRELAADGAPSDVTRRHQLTSNYEMTVMGLSRYWQKQHPERLG